jgi:hypothetical protein
MRRSRAVSGASASILGLGPVPTTGAPRTRSAPHRESARLHGLEHAGGRIRARLDLAGREHLITYRFAGIEPDQSYEPFVVAATPLAMRRGTPLSVPTGLSARLRRGVSSAQRILHSWYPELQPIEIQAPLEPSAAALPSNGGGVACFFTGGVDSFYSALRNLDRLDALIHVHGFDVPLADRARREVVITSVRRAAEELGLPLIEVETDLRLTSNRYADWGRYHGAALASIALLASSRFREVLIPATYSYRVLLPWGSHALLDPLWSTEAVEVVYDGAVSRPEKLRAIAGSEIAMRHLHVCFRHSLHGITDLNCGSCEKCMRTIAGLRAVGAMERCATLPRRLRLRKVAWRPIWSEHTMVRTRENLAAAEAAGDRALAWALRWRISVGPWRTRMNRVCEVTMATVRRHRRRVRRHVRRVRRWSARRLGRAASAITRV